MTLHTCDDVGLTKTNLTRLHIKLQASGKSKAVADALRIHLSDSFDLNGTSRLVFKDDGTWQMMGAGVRAGIFDQRLEMPSSSHAMSPYLMTELSSGYDNSELYDPRCTAEFESPEVPCARPDCWNKVTDPGNHTLCEKHQRLL